MDEPTMTQDEEAIWNTYVQFKQELWTWMDEKYADLPVHLGAIFVATAGLGACIEGLGMPVDEVMQAVNAFRGEAALEDMPTDGTVN